MPDDTAIFTVQVQMRKRWVPHFLAMLKYMQYLGSVGSSRNVTFMSDGDGDFRPKFSLDMALPYEANPVEDVNGNRTYDAG
jgi:hypothetical protein